MPQILIRNLSQRAHSALRQRAVEHRTSLEGEVRAILEAATQPTEGFVLPAMVVPGQRGGKSLAQLVSEGRR
jgi:plasmid stability protein